MKVSKIMMLGFLLLFLSGCGMFENQLLEESENPEADEQALNFIESYVNRDLESFRDLMSSDEELESYAQYRVDRQGSTGNQIYSGMEFDEVMEALEEDSITTNDFSEDELEVIANYSDDEASYVATHGIRESREADYFQIDEKGIFNSTLRNMYGSDESFIIFTFEVDESGNITNLNSDYEAFTEDMANKEQTYILKGEADPSGG